MSTYLTMEGFLTFPNQEALNNAVAMLQQGGWLRKDGVFQDECRDAMEFSDPLTEAIDQESLELNFPYGLYRNIGPTLDQIYPGTTGKVVWTCTDGCCCAGVIENGKETVTHDLEKWGKENVAVPDEIAAALATGGRAGDDEYHQHWAEWMTEVERVFIAENTSQ